ncbi:MAG: PEP-CTERM sorting domain-containing protein [Phycisphaerae bacterium]|nr:PEP-CTERM sorting domain-containing protein [Phycisphaerae bacterium]
MRQFGILTACVVLCVAGQALAVDVDFSGYAIGDLTGQSAWTASGGVSAAAGATWSFDDGGNDGTAMVVGGDLGTAGSETSASPYVSVTNGTGGNWGTYARLDVEGVSDDGWWLAGIVRHSTTEGWAGLQLYRGGTELFGIGHAWDHSNYGMFGAGGDVDSDTAIDTETPALLVAHYDGAGLTMWVNPDLTKTEAENTPNAIDDDAGDQSGIDNIRLRLGNANYRDINPVMDVDNIYLGNESPFGSATVPEPTALVLLGLGGVGVLLKRRRSQS